MFAIPRSLNAFPFLFLFSAAAVAQEPVEVQTKAPPEELIAPAGTVLTVLIRDHLSSHENEIGDSFTGMLQQPLVIDGWVVARGGQTVVGQVRAANAAGRVKGTSDLGLVLSELALVDGHQSPVRTELFVARGKESRKADAAAIGGVAAIGSIIGAATGGGKGAAIGAGVGAGAATAGVLATRGKPADVRPESVLTFRLDSPLVVVTVGREDAFLRVVSEDYEPPPALKPQRQGHDSAEATPSEYDRYPRFPRQER